MSKTEYNSFGITGIKKLQALKNNLEQLQQDNQVTKKREKKNVPGLHQAQSMQALEQYEEQIVSKYNDLYKNKPEEEIINQIQVLENRPLLLKEIHKNDDQLNQDKKVYNQLRYEMDQLAQKLKKLENQYEQMIEQEKQDQTIQVQYDKITAEYKSIKLQYEDQIFL